MASNQLTDAKQRQQQLVAYAKAPLPRIGIPLTPTKTQPDSSPSSEQQRLLLAALHSQADNKEPILAQAREATERSKAAILPSAMNGSTMFMSPQNAELDSTNADYTPDLDYLDNENFNFEDADLGGEMIGALPGDGHEKRSSPHEKDDVDEPDAKRQETSEVSEKSAKKPGRKPLMNVPTTKRKAQNRAAQRAFRERKEKHLKDLESKVQEVTKSAEADKHENGLLKAQVERLQTELREYRKRLSLNSSNGGARGSPPLTAYTGQNRSSSNPSYGNANDFHFDFPKFGGLPGSQIFGSRQQFSADPNDGLLQRSSITPPFSQSPTTFNRAQPPQPHRKNSSPQSRISTKTIGSTSSTSTDSAAQSTSFLPSVGYSISDNMHGFASTLPQMGGDNPFGDLFSPSLLKSANMDNSNAYFANAQQKNQPYASFDTLNGGESTAGLNRVFQFNGGSSASDSASPSSSNWNNNGTNSSCGTSPEPSHDSPANKVDRSFSQSSKAPSQLPANYNIGLTGNNLDYSVPVADSFDPVLFGDYRDPGQDSGFVDDFGNGFFDEALNPGPYDFDSPSNLFGILDSPQQTNTALPSTNTTAAPVAAPSQSLMAQCDKARDGMDDDYGLPNAQQKQQQAPQQKTESKLISCNNIWNQLQSNPDFQAGTFDLDSLCSELRAKARCSESGVMVDQDHVDKALKKLGKKDDKGKYAPEVPADMPTLIFEQESWNSVLNKMGGKA
ncbi:PAP1-domain-containing protein [Teratosphaeria nubilosa]|uniref:PAP1-domain-containing protein n=1 Tax=Teratosphaeria nubilosa TaxID=161662 RepID=A0A6G1LHL9_9PEZI|nr:PAP1-domain-containing protein [Teratosphaeria nubilosa]